LQAYRTVEHIDGILLLDKAEGMTSNAALQAAKRLLGAKKAGHGGTLDPLATGLLMICFGEATKFSAVLLDAEKTYAAQVRLGVTTRTGDAEGEVTSRQTVEIDDNRLRTVLREFVGGYEQLPPAYSALKHRGRPLYEYARAGHEAPRSRRAVEISRLSLDQREGDQINLTVTCGKGTYVRSLAEDIGVRLGCGAHLAALRRLASGPFRLDDAVALPAIEAESLEARRARLLASDVPLLALPEVVVAPDTAVRLWRGQRVIEGWEAPSGLVRLYVESIPRRFMGLGEITADGCLVPRRLMVEKEA